MGHAMGAAEISDTHRRHMSGDTAANDPAQEWQLSVKEMAAAG